MKTNKEEQIQLAEDALLHVYNRFSLVLDKGDGVYLYDTDCISQIEEDFQRTCKKCRTVTYTTCRREKPSVKLTGFVAKAVAPLM